MSLRPIKQPARCLRKPLPQSLPQQSLSLLVQPALVVPVPPQLSALSMSPSPLMTANSGSRSGGGERTTGSARELPRQQQIFAFRLILSLAVGLMLALSHRSIAMQTATATVATEVNASPKPAASIVDKQSRIYHQDDEPASTSGCNTNRNNNNNNNNNNTSSNINNNNGNFNNNFDLSEVLPRETDLAADDGLHLKYLNGFHSNNRFGRNHLPTARAADAASNRHLATTKTKTIDNNITTETTTTLDHHLDGTHKQWAPRPKRDNHPARLEPSLNSNASDFNSFTSLVDQLPWPLSKSPLSRSHTEASLASSSSPPTTLATSPQTPLLPPSSSNHSTGVQLAKNHLKTIRQVPPLSNQPSVELSAPSQQAAAAAAAYALAQEDKKAANKLNAELCKNFSIGIQHETGGVFTSPNYPNPYPANLICTKLIEAPSGYYVVLEFRDQFNIEEAGTDCDNDKIEIRDGRFGYSKVLARYCGNRFPPEVRSTDEAMWLRFISDGSITHTGFKAVYRFEKQKNTKPPPPFECRFNVTTMPTLPGVNGTENRTGIHSGIIKNTDVPEKLIEYSKQYNVSLECIWNITVTPGWKIYLTFSSYEINKPNDCDSNFIEIYEENLTEENQTVKFCGTRTEPQQSRSNVFNIRHHAIPSASSSKFEIIYTAFREKGQAGCDTREFDCDDGTCIHESLKCDGTINCKYRYDEASEPGPCAIGEDVQPFFETEHMVIILIVFLTLVSGMCASIIVSCWGKIQERRRRKLEYHMRKSREASMEGQMNKVDQLYGSNDGSNGGATGRQNTSAPNNLKQRLTAPIAPSENHLTQQQHYGTKYPYETGPFPPIGDQQQLLNGSLDIEQQRQLLTSGAHFGQHPASLIMQQQQQQQQHQQQQLNRNNTIIGDNYGHQTYESGRAQLQNQQQLIGASNPNLNANFRMLQQQQQHQPSDHQERSMSVYGSRSKTLQQQRNLQGGIYGVQQGQASSLAGNNLSSSITCCNMPNETPLISDLVKRANMQQQHQVNNRLMQMAQANNAMRMQQQISDAAPAMATIPRSISAYQLSKSQLRLNQQQQQLQRQHQQLLQQQRHQAQSTHAKSMSDAGQANKHQPPNHSLSYPHACSGAHAGDLANAMGANDSPALPPPPPPPNLMPHQVGQTSCATLPPQMSDNKRHAFKVSRLDPSQLTGDTLPDSDLVMTNMPLGSMQFDDVSTESDATFGMLVDSVGNASLNYGPQMNRQASTMAPSQQPQHPLLLSQSCKTMQPISHLSECNLIRRQRAEALASEGGSIGRQQMLMSQSSCICDCGALERANQLRQHQEHALLGQHFPPPPPPQQQQRQLVQSDTRDFDMDSDEAKAMHGVPYGFTGDINDSNNFVMAAQMRPGRQIVHLNHGNILNYNGSVLGNPTNQQQQMRLDRFRQQSSELTADDDEDVEDDDEDDRNGMVDGFVGNNLEGQVDVDDDEISSDAAISQRRPTENQKSAGKFNTVSGNPKSIVRRNKEELRDVEGLRQKHLSGSHTSICTCGSQAKLDMNDLVDDDDEDNDYGDVASLSGQKMSQTTVKSQSVANNDTNVHSTNPGSGVNDISAKQAPGSKQDFTSTADRNKT
uniref:Neuropilin and tolloid-like protein 1 n=2 Tax=Aceria tosichella TaxID=561515 RepID=A0A6G1SCB2_9ACAR